MFKNIASYYHYNIRMHWVHSIAYHTDKTNTQFKVASVMMSRRRNYIKTRFIKENEKQAKHKTREEMKKVRDNQMKMQTSSLWSRMSQFIMRMRNIKCGENLKKGVVNDSNRRNEEMLVKGQTESSTMYCVCRLLANLETGLWDCQNKL